MIRLIWRTLRDLMPGLAEKKKRSARHAAGLSSCRLARIRLTRRSSSAIWHWFTRGRASATARWSNSKKLRRSRDRSECRHTAISVSIRAGILCAVTSASTRSLPQPRLPADRSLELLDQSDIPESSQVIISEARIGAAKFETKLLRWVLTKYIVHTNGDRGVVHDLFPARHGVSSCGRHFLLFAHHFLLAL